MREDMYKLIVERPRRRYGDPPLLSRDGRHFRDCIWPDEDGGNAPHHLGMKAGYRNKKYLNENLAPLKRWLTSQVNRPWNKVYSELCANIDRRNTVQEHIFTHINDFVAKDARWVNGEVMVVERWGRHCIPIGEARAELFVHPRTGILLANRARIRHKHEIEAAKAHRQAECAAQLKALSETEILLLIEEDWFAVTLAPLPQGVASGQIAPSGREELRYEPRWDVVRKKSVSGAEERHARAENSLYGKLGWYAVAKQQLGAKDIKRHGLKQKAGKSRPFAFWCTIVFPVPPVHAQAPRDPSGPCRARSAWS